MCDKCFHQICKYAWVKPLTNLKAKTALYGFIGIVNKAKGKPNKLWVNQGKEFYGIRMQKWLIGNDILMYLIYSKGKSVVAERFIGTLKGKIYKKRWHVIVVLILII